MLATVAFGSAIALVSSQIDAFIKKNGLFKFYIRIIHKHFTSVPCSEVMASDPFVCWRHFTLTGINPTQTSERSRHLHCHSYIKTMFAKALSEQWWGKKYGETARKSETKHSSRPRLKTLSALKIAPCKNDLLDGCN